jgi:hypothetical protein
MSYGAITRSPSRFGFISFGQNFLPVGSNNGIEPGGECMFCKADAAQTLNLGDVVYWSDAGEVSKSATQANYQLFAGVVVGGARSNYEAVVDEGIVVAGYVAAAAGEAVIIQTAGVALCRLAAGTTIAAAPAIVGVGTTAGRLVTVATGAVVGIALTDQGTAGDVIFVQLRPSISLVA